MTGRRLHRSATVALSTLMTVLGAALVVEGVLGVGALLPRLLLGVLFLAAGSGRLYVEVRGRR